MRSIGIFVVLALATTSLAPGQQRLSNSDSTAIMNAMANWERGWATGNAELASRDYAEDADWTNAYGMRLVGRDTLRAFLARIFQIPRLMAAGTEYRWHDLRPLGPGVAALRSFATRPETADSLVEAPRRINHLRVFVKRDGGWQITSHLIADERTFIRRAQRELERTSRAAVVDTGAVLAIIDSLRTRFERIVAAGDFQALSGVLAEGAVMVGPGGAAWDSLRAASEYPFPPGATIEITPIETVVLSEEWAYDFGTSVATYTPPGSREVRTLRDTYLLLLRNTSSGWKIYREVASPALPPKGVP